MRCPICNREMPEGSRKCSYCGTKLKALFKPEHKYVISIGTFLICIFLVLVIGIGTGFGIAHLSAQQPTASAPTLSPSTVPSTTAPVVELQKGYIRYTSHIDSYYNHVQARQDPLIVFRNEIGIRTSVTSWSWQKIERSLDGDTCIMLSELGELYAVHNTSFRFIAEDVHDFRLSADGSTLAYTAMIDGAFHLFYYSFHNYFRQDIFTTPNRPDYCISPDGGTLAYIDSLTHELLVYDNKETHSRGYCNGSLVGISNNGEYIYTFDTWYVYCIMQAETKSYKCNGSFTFYFNADHRQLLFEYQSQAYICGMEEGLFLQQWTEPFLPKDSITCISTDLAITLPLYDLYGHIYTTSDFGETDIFFITRSVNHKICRSGKPVAFSPLNDMLYYTKGDQLYRCILSSEFLSILVVDGISPQPCYPTESNGQIFYSIGSHLMMKDLVSNQEPVEITNILKIPTQASLYPDRRYIHTYAMDHNGNLYYIERGSGSSGNGTVYLYQFDGKPRSIAYSIQNLYVSPNGMVFAINDVGTTFYLNGETVTYAAAGEYSLLGMGSADS